MHGTGEEGRHVDQCITLLPQASLALGCECLPGGGELILLHRLGSMLAMSMVPGRVAPLWQWSLKYRHGAAQQQCAAGIIALRACLSASYWHAC